MHRQIRSFQTYWSWIHDSHESTCKKIIICPPYKCQGSTIQYIDVYAKTALWGTDIETSSQCKCKTCAEEPLY